MFGIASSEYLVILVVAILVLGPEHLPRIMRTVGKLMSDFRRISTELQRVINLESFDAEIMGSSNKPTSKSTVKKKASSKPKTKTSTKKKASTTPVEKTETSNQENVSATEYDTQKDMPKNLSCSTSSPTDASGVSQEVSTSQQNLEEQSSSEQSQTEQSKGQSIKEQDILADSNKNDSVTSDEAVSIETTVKMSCNNENEKTISSGTAS